MNKNNKKTEEKNYSDVLQVRGIRSQGYGLMPKMVARDRRLSMASKGIYSYFVSFAGAGQTAFPSIPTILYDLKTSKDTFYKHFELLKRYGYITVIQERNFNGGFGRNIYTLEEFPEQVERDLLQKKELENMIFKTSKEKKNPYPKISDTVETSEFIGFSPCPKNKDTIFQDTKNQDSNNNNLNINNSIIISQSQRQTKKQKNDLTMTDDKDFKQKEKISKSKDFKKEQQQDYEAILEMLKENINYPELLVSHSPSIGIVDELLGCMLDVILTEKETVRINSEEKPRALVIGQYWKINYEDIAHIISKYLEQGHKIKNIGAYLKTMLFNVKLERSGYFANNLRAANPHSIDGQWSEERKNRSAIIKREWELLQKKAAETN